MGTRTAVVAATLLLVAAGATTATVGTATATGTGTGPTTPAAVGVTGPGLPDRPAPAGSLADRSPTRPSLAGPTAGGAPTAGPLAASPPGESIRTQVETDRIRLRIEVLDDGTARWRIRYVTELDDENTSDAFESLQADIGSNPDAYTERFAGRIRNTVGTAENATGREMTARSFTVEARTGNPGGCPQPYGCGIITYTYEWTNFAAVADGGDRLTIGDAIDAYYIDGSSTLVVSWPEEYGLASADPEPDATSAGSLSWSGERDFLPGQPRIVVEAGATGTTGTGTGPGGDGGDDGSGDGGDGDGGTGDGGGFPVTTVLVALVVLVAAAGGVFYFTRGEDPPEPSPGASEHAAGAGAGGADATAGAAGGSGDASDDAAAAEPAEGDGDDGGEADDEPAIDEELLSNEERVLRLLERRGGRIKQQEVVQELDWTEAKTSQVVSGMRDEGTIDGFRLGRENVLTLPDVDEGPLPDDDGDDGDSDDDETPGDRSWGDT